MTMLNAFISCNKQDREFVQTLEERLGENRVKIWRERGELYGQPGWPRAIGEKIAETENFVLVWSRHASLSHIIEFEWHLAQLLERKLIVLMLDDTPLREKLAPADRLACHGASLPLEKLLAALQAPPLVHDEAEIEQVVKKLTRFNETKPAQVMQKLRIVYFNSRIENPRIRL